MSGIEVKQAAESDRATVLSVVGRAFGEEEEVVDLVQELLEDPSSVPRQSLLAWRRGEPVGYILFTRAVLEEDRSLSLSILAPLAVVPEAQNQGVGTRLTAAGVDLLAGDGGDLVFVLGYPDYYTRHGFEPAGRLGFAAPYPIAEENADAWMVRELRSGLIDRHSGSIRCAEAMDKPEYWRE